MGQHLTSFDYVLLSIVPVIKFLKVAQLFQPLICNAYANGAVPKNGAAQQVGLSAVFSLPVCYSVHS